jgi:hypothetical protein
MRIRGGRAGRITALLAVTIAAAGWGPTPAGGQVAPVVSIVPDASTTPGEWFMILVEGCTPLGDAPSVSYAVQASDATHIEDMVPNDVDAWHLEVQAPATDVHVVAIDGCVQGEADLTGGYADVENPILFANPLLGIQATSVVGTDCPDGATPEASLWLERTQILLDPSAPDGHGDWRAELPDSLEAGAMTGEVHAVCGAVTYATLTVALGEVVAGPSTTAPSTTTSAPRPPAAPATPVDTAARFTG